MKTSEERARLEARLRQSFMFSSLSPQEFEIVVNAISSLKVSAGEVVIREGDQGDCMYVVESGTYTCSKYDKKAKISRTIKSYS